jgi:tetratricopeptide (TPR) repeat protein
VKFEKISHLICLAQFRIGKLVFPMFEPMLHFLENKGPEVRKHFNQALISTKEKKQAIALLNLNMVLSLNPGHFLARIFRGRIYYNEGQYRLASEDYLEANKISQYRFFHYDLYQEYFRLVNRRFGGTKDTTIKNFDQYFKTLILRLDDGCRGGSAEMVEESSERLSRMEAFLKKDDEITSKKFILSPDETEKFMVMGPITQEEIEEADWDQLADDLRY